MALGTVESAKGTRCLRCGTLIRANRPRCPSCDLDFTMSSSSPAPEPVARASSSSRSAPAESKAKPRKAKEGVKLCPMCMNSVTENEMGEANGQKVCAACANSVKQKAAKPKPEKPDESKEK